MNTTEYKEQEALIREWVQRQQRQQQQHYHVLRQHQWIKSMTHEGSPMRAIFGSSAMRG